MKLRRIITAAFVALALTGFSTLFLTSIVQAEHRVALLIDNHAHQDESLAQPAGDLDAVAKALSNFGFRCIHVKDLDDQKLKATVTSFAETTPTRGTAVIFFSGPTSMQESQGKRDLGLLGVNSRTNQGVKVGDVLGWLNEKGGSSLNLLLVDTSSQVDAKALSELPTDSAVALVGAEAFAKSAGDSQDLLKSVKADNQQFAANLPSDAAIVGKGTQAISPPEEFRAGNRAGDEWVDGWGQVFCWCPPGKFQLGSPGDEDGRFQDETLRDVEVKQGFWISKYELTRGQWKPNMPRFAIGSHKNHPINTASQSKDGGRHLKVLNEGKTPQTRIPTNWEYALPTEAQWEYAARAGTKEARYFGDDVGQLPQHANFGDLAYFNTKSVFSISAHRTLNDDAAHLAVVGSYQPNPWGLHDVYGNVAEWCDNAVARGGSWVSTPEYCRSAFRHQFGDRDTETYIGFRVIIRPKTDASNGK